MLEKDLKRHKLTTFNINDPTFAYILTSKVVLCQNRHTFRWSCHLHCGLLCCHTSEVGAVKLLIKEAWLL